MEEKGAVVPFFVALDAYVKKGVGIDMVMKSLLGIFRIMAIHTKNREMSAHYAEFAFKIVNCRMLANHFRHFMSFVGAIKIFNKKEGPIISWFSLFLSFFFRSLEQVFGDLNYYQMIMMHHWSRSRLTFGYHFFKSLSLTCGLINELSHVKRIIGMHGETRMTAIKASVISLVRYLCDMAVYYQWLPFYNPPKTVQYGFGSMAGILGVYVVWNETKKSLVAGQTPINIITVNKPVMCKKKDPVIEDVKDIKNAIEEQNTVKPTALPVAKKIVLNGAGENVKEDVKENNNNNDDVPLDAKQSAHETVQQENKPSVSVPTEINGKENVQETPEAGDVAYVHSGEKQKVNSALKTNDHTHGSSDVRFKGSAKARAYGRNENNRRGSERSAPAVSAE